MQKFTRQERIGIAAVAVVSILICGAGMFLNRRSSDNKEFIIEEKLFFNNNDTLSGNEGSAEEIKEIYTGEKSNGRKKGKRNGKDDRNNKGRKSVKIKKGKNNTSKPSPPRDYLKDEIKRHKEHKSEPD